MVTRYLFRKHHYPGPLCHQLYLGEKTQGPHLDFYRFGRLQRCIFHKTLHRSIGRQAEKSVGERIA
jgi:hypothetical protein